MIKPLKCGFLIFTALVFLVMSGCYSDAKEKGKSTEITHAQQIQIDDEILAKEYAQLTDAEKERLKEIYAAQELKRSNYEKRAYKQLKNNQPKSFEEYLEKSKDFKNEDMADVNPQYEANGKFGYVPEPEFKVVKYNYPAGSRELNLSTIRTKRSARGQGVLSPDSKFVVYTDVNYESGIRKASSNAYIIPVMSQEYITKKRVEYLHKKEDELHQLIEKLETAKKEKKLTRKEKKELEQVVKKAQEEVDLIRLSQERIEKNQEEQNSPAQQIARALLSAHIKDRVKEPIMSTGLFDNDYGIQRTLTVVDWSSDSKKILFKEKIMNDHDGVWRTNIWVYDMETGDGRKLDEVRQAIEYYWKKDRLIDLHNYRYDLYPLGWDANHPDRIMLYAYGYTKEPGTPPKFLGTWSIDIKGEQSRLISVTRTGYTLQANGYCLQVKNLEYYAK